MFFSRMTVTFHQVMSLQMNTGSGEETSNEIMSMHCCIFSPGIILNNVLYKKKIFKIFKNFTNY